MDMIFGEALVTSKGIKFQNNYYSCERAIRERWFELAHMCGEWSIHVTYCPTSMESIYLTLYMETEQCRIIVTHEYLGSKLEKYFQSIQKLKQEWRKAPKIRARVIDVGGEDDGGAA